MKRYHQDKELTIYQQEILNQKQPADLKKAEGEKTYFPDLLTPYQRALLRGEKPEEIEILKQEEKNDKKSNKTLRGALLLCYIASVLGSANIQEGATFIIKSKPSLKKDMILINQNERNN